MLHLHPASGTGRHSGFTTTEPAPGLFFVEGPASNWIIVSDETGFILIDCGYPADTSLVMESIHEQGLDPAAAKAILITHGHVDHTGSAALFSRLYGTPVLCSPEELAHVQGLEKHQVTLGQVLVRAWRPLVFKWMLHAIGAGSLKAEPATSARAWTPELLAGLPGSPEAVLVPGHTMGHAALLLKKANAVATGDALVTGHAISQRRGPLMLHPMFHHRTDQVLDALDVLAGLGTLTVLPGHGAAVHGAMADIVTAARK